MLVKLTLAELKMFVRNRQALFWALVFPLIFVVVFGLFDLDRPGSTTIAVVDQAQDPLSAELIKNLGTLSLVNLRTNLSEEQARQELKAGEGGFVLIIPPQLAARVQTGAVPVPLTLVYDESDAQVSLRYAGVIRQFVDQANLALNNARPLLEMQLEGLQAKKVGYFDFLLPGLVAMGVMTYGIIGMADGLALYRQNKILKRLLTTPLRVRVFFASQVISRLVIALAQSSIILAVGVFFFKAHVYGNLLWMLMLVLIANVIFLNLGFIVGAIAKTVQAADGLANAMSMPMMFLSGVFFPTETLPSILAHAVKYLPLTPLLAVMRGVIIDALPIWKFPGDLALLGAWIVVSSLLAIRVFRFE